jgi:hypothetical protein
MTIEQICEEEYGISAFYIEPIALIWAAEKLIKIKDVEFAKKELRKVNKGRNKRGIIPAYPAYGSELF